MKRATLFKLVWGAAFWMLASTALAGDILLIEKVRERQGRDLPVNGLTMAAVEDRYGAPAERRPAVGEPPITRWLYDDFTVYFEHDLVIESVVHDAALARAGQSDPEP